MAHSEQHTATSSGPIFEARGRDDRIGLQPHPLGIQSHGKPVDQHEPHVVARSRVFTTRIPESHKNMLIAFLLRTFGAIHERLRRINTAASRPAATTARAPRQNPPRIAAGVKAAGLVGNGVGVISAAIIAGVGDAWMTTGVSTCIGGWLVGSCVGVTTIASV